MQRDSSQAASARRTDMVEQVRALELVRDRLQSLQRLTGSFPEGHGTRALLEDLHLGRALRKVEGEIEALRDALLHPRGT